MEKCVHDLSGRTAFITGAGSGIGRAAAQTMAAAGASIGVLDRELTKAEATVRTLGGEHRRHLPMGADVGDEGEMELAFAHCRKAWSHLDILVINAGINGVWCPLDDLKAQEWDDTMRVNLRGTFLTLKLALPLLRVRGGSVVIVSSINGTRLFNNRGATAYACSKAAQVAFAKMTALELAPEGIRVNVVCPGTIDTNIHRSTSLRNVENIQGPPKTGHVPLTGGTPGTPDDVSRAICFLASDASRHISGTEIYIDGAQSLLCD